MMVQKGSGRKRLASFKDRLESLMQGEKPYRWARRVGIKKGVFQYYWERGGKPSADNLLKIQQYTGCSLEWLVTGKDRYSPKGVDRPSLVREMGPAMDQNPRLERLLGKVRRIFDKGSKKDRENLELMVDRFFSGKTR
jgi:phage repressor protein C with HTH and peptisase S24 domain